MLREKQNKDKTTRGRFKLIKLNIPRQELSFCVTESCDLNCSYCYLPRKNTGRKMKFDAAKKAIDYFLRNTEFFSAPSLTIDFIGGEPLLEVELMDQISDYFKVKAFKMDHHWFENYKLTFTTNGTHYRREKVQKFIEKNRNCLFPAISLDGVEEKHDNARKYRNGRGSYKDVVKSAKLMIEQLPQTTIKATFGRGDIKYFKESFIHFLELGFPLENIYANVAYEDLWDDNDDLLFEEQLVELADYLIDNDICNSMSFGNVFSNAIGKPYTDEHLAKHWCNSGHGVIVSVDGSLFPCIRFLEIAFDNKDTARKIGDVEKGIDFDKLRPFRVLTLKNCSPQKCLECQVASGCNMCSGQALSESPGRTIFSRPTYICKMHKARVRANKYFFKKLSKKEKKKLYKDDYLRELRIMNKKILNILFSSDSPPICSYDPNETGNKKSNQLLHPDVLKKYLSMAKKKSYYINYIYPNHDIDETYQSIIALTKFQVTRPYKDECTKSSLKDGEIFIFNVGQPISQEFSCANVILHLVSEQLKCLKDYIIKLFSQGVIRINLIIDDLAHWKKADMSQYKDVLMDISDLFIDFFKRGHQKSFNVLTDRLILDKMNNCNAGIEHITLGPDGRLYLCPAFYYQNKPLGQDELDMVFSAESLNLLKLENAPICKNCDAYQCRRCFFYNLDHTGELNIPGEKQCLISHIEREVSRILQDRLISRKLIPYPNRNLIMALNYLDPFEISKVW